MTEMIRYAANGDRRYFLDGAEVSADDYRAHAEDRDCATLAATLAEGRPPHGVTDSTFMAGRWEQNAAAHQDYRATAESLGVSTQGKAYISGLARFPGDPEAFVDGRGDVKRLCDKRGWGCEGTVNVKHPERLEPKPGPEVAADIVNDEVAGILANVPEPERVDVQDLREQVIEKRKPRRKAR